jgi:2-dehydropantoate 2-reductase
MRIIVLGAGAIGSFFGARLSRYNDVLLVGNKEHAEAISKNGLRITNLENKNYKVCASDRINKIEDDTLVILSTKVISSESAIKNIKSLLRKDTTILCLQNGLYSEDAVKNIAGNECLVLRAITNFGAAFLKPGEVSYNSDSYTAIEKSKKSKEISEVFSKAGLNAYVANDIKHEMWKKAVFNCVLNPLTSIFRMKNSGICDKGLDSLKKAISDECVAVAEKDGTKLDIDFVREINKAFKNSANISSMQQDLMKGKKTEIDYLNGAVVELGKKHGIKCHANEVMCCAIKWMESIKHR